MRDVSEMEKRMTSKTRMRLPYAAPIHIRKGSRFTVEMRFFSLVACWAWCLEKQTLTWRRGEREREGERTCMDNFSRYNAERGCVSGRVRGRERGEAYLTLGKREEGEGTTSRK